MTKNPTEKGLLREGSSLLYGLRRRLEAVKELCLRRNTYSI